MFKKLRGLFSTDMSIDLGTANTLIYMPNKGIALNEPSVVAVKNRGNEKIVVAVGSDAKRMLGRTPDNIEAIRPLKDGVIADFQVTEKMLQHFIKKMHTNSFINPSPRVLVCVPCKATQVERRAIKESALGAGARKVYLIEEPLAAAIGAGLPVEEATASMVLDIGGGTTEIAIMSLGSSVYAESVRVGGDRFNEAIVAYIRRKHGILIGEITAEKIKEEIGTAYEPEEIVTSKICGRNLLEGIPCTIEISNKDIFEALQETLKEITSAVKQALEQAPPELSADLATTGIYLTGGGALLNDLSKMISVATKLPVIIAEDPATCVARGGGMALELIENNQSFSLSFNEDIS
jgi:rod shape-determining protein MreB and related proteins